MTPSFLRAHASRIALLACFVPTIATRASAQHPAEQPNASEILHKMQKLNVLGSVLYIAAHPDDENTKLITWLANGKKVRTGYLSLTRGDGGQNLIGTEQGDALGIIRTQELMEARRIDGGEQFFTRAVDFGFSKNAAESFEKWGKDKVLSDVVRVIRTFRPDVIITRFPPTREAGHGHHEASALLAAEAFDLAGDPTAFPEQLQEGLQVWQPRRLFFNGSTWWRKELPEIAKKDPDWCSVDVGGYEPLLGASFTEIAGRSRSMHKSQGFGAAETRGEQFEFLHFEKGDRPKGTDPFEGIDMRWERIVGAAPIRGMVERLCGAYDPVLPERSVPALVEIRKAIDALPFSTWKDRMGRLTDDLLLYATGTVLEAISATPDVVTGKEFEVTFNALTRCNEPVRVQVAATTAVLDTMRVSFPANANYSTPVRSIAPLAPDMPFWLRLPHGSSYNIQEAALIGKPVTPGQLAVEAAVVFEGGLVVKRRVPVLYHWVDRVKGELVRECVVVPPASVFAAPQVIMVRDDSTTVHIGIDAYTDSKDVKLTCEMVADWDIAPSRQNLGPAQEDDRIGAEFTMRPINTERPTSPDLRVDMGMAGPGNLTRRSITYDHIMPQIWYTAATFKAVPLDVKVTSNRVGYIAGAGDDVAKCIEQLGAVVEPIDAAMVITPEALAKYDAIVVGIRAYNSNQAMKRFNPTLMRYVENGGTVVVQYTTRTSDMVLPDSLIGPYPFKLTRDRVTVEDAPATFLAKDHPLLNSPNKITEKDFEGWIQERGLYFCNNLDPHYTPLIAWNDPGEQPLDGSLITCDYGKGRYVYTGISFFRQLPAGVPGAYRLFANLISKRASPDAK